MNALMSPNGPTVLMDGDRIAIIEKMMYMLELRIFRAEVQLTFGESAEVLEVRSSLDSLKTLVLLSGFELIAPANGHKPGAMNTYTLKKVVQ